MKLPLLLCALLLSTHGWCASVTPSERTLPTVAAGNHMIRKDSPRQVGDRPSQEEKENAKTAMIAAILITYLTALLWWTVAARRSLDNVLKDVLQNMAQYP